MPHAYSIRQSLQGALEDFVRDSGFTCVYLEGLIREAEQSELDDLYSRAVSALPQDDNRALLAYYAKVNAGAKPEQAEAENADALIMEGVNALAPAIRLRFRAVFSRMIEAGLNRIE